MKRRRAVESLYSLCPRLEARGIAHAGLFGFVGRDHAGAESDVDIVVTPFADRQLDLWPRGG